MLQIYCLLQIIQVLATLLYDLATEQKKVHDNELPFQHSFLCHTLGDLISINWILVKI